MDEDDGTRYFTVERQVPIPNKENVPVKELEVGDSVAFPEFKRNAVASTASRLKKEEGKEFTVRKIGENTCRVWRTK